jgi:ABC-type transport system involved in Fe-S cluster assembly fused permease/ATPase subunit
MNKKKEIDKLVRLTILSNFISSKLKEQRTIVKSFVGDEKVLKGLEHKMNVIKREYKKFDSARFKVEQPLMYSQYRTQIVESIELKPIVDHDQESDLLTENFPMLQMQTQ